MARSSFTKLKGALVRSSTDAGSPMPETPTLNKLLSQSGSATKVASIPLVTSSAKVGQDFVATTPILTQVEHNLIVLTEWIAATVVINLAFLAGLALVVDSWGVKLLNKVEQWVPSLFTTTAPQVQQAVKKQYDGARSYAVATGTKAQTQLAQLKQQHMVLQRSYDSLVAINAQLVTVGTKVKSKGTQVSTQATATAQLQLGLVYTEMERLQQYLVSLPADAQKRFTPLQQNVLTKYDQTMQQLKQSQSPLAPRLMAVSEYVSTSVLPALSSALNSVPLTKTTAIAVVTEDEPAAPEASTFNEQPATETVNGHK